MANGVLNNEDFDQLYGFILQLFPWALSSHSQLHWSSLVLWITRFFSASKHFCIFPALCLDYFSFHCMQDWLFLIFPSTLSPPKEVFWGIMFNTVLVPTSLYNSIYYPFSLHSLQLIIILFIYLFIFVDSLPEADTNRYLFHIQSYFFFIKKPCYGLDDHCTEVNKNTHFPKFSCW